MKALAAIAGAVLMIPEITRLRSAIEDDLVLKYNSVNGIRDELVSLTDELFNIQSWMEKLEQVLWPHEEMFDWYRRATEIRYEVDHYISEFLCEQNSCTRDLMVRHRLVTHVKDLKRRLKNLASNYRSNNWDQLTTSSMFDGLGCRTSSVLIQDHEELIGFQEQLANLKNLLKYDKNDGLKVISVVGSGGSGKTALALEVLSLVKSGYESYASVCVSGCLDTASLLMDLYMQLGNMDPSTGKLQTDQLIRKLSDLLATKRYLIFLDDLWRTEMWETLKPAFPRNKMGSKIILTSRINSVALICSKRGELVLRIPPLNDDDSRRLFLGSIYGTDSCPSQFERNMAMVLEKCRGIPLLILRMAGHILGRGPTRIDAWEEISSDLNCFQGCYQSESLFSLHQNLFLSYTLLPRHLKDCVLALAGLPGGSTLDIDVVISLWVAEDFVASRSGGEAIVDELVNQHLIQPVKIAEDGRTESVTVSMLMHNMLAKISDDKGFYTAAPKSVSRLHKTRLNRLSLVSEDVRFIAASNVMSHHTRAIMLYSCRGVPNLGTCKFLRFLLLDWCGDFSDSNLKPIIELAYLKVLILKTPSVSELPLHMDKLRMLEVLILEDTLVTKMPNGINRFEMLTCLKVGIVAFPAGIAMLQKLEKLEIFDVGSSSEVAVKDLGKLHKLKVLSCRWNTQINNGKVDEDDNCVEWFETALYELASKGKLEELTLSGGKEKMTAFSCFPFGKMSKLRKLHMYDQCYMICVPRSLISLLKLTLVSISLEDFNPEDVTRLGGLPSLGFLYMWMKCPTTIEFSKGMFPQLRRFAVYSDALKLEFKQGCLLKLEKLHMMSPNEVVVSDLQEVRSLRYLFVSIVGADNHVVSTVTTTITNVAALCQGIRTIIKSEAKRDQTDPLFGEEI